MAPQPDFLAPQPDFLAPQPDIFWLPNRILAPQPDFLFWLPNRIFHFGSPAGFFLSPPLPDFKINSAENTSTKLLLWSYGSAHGSHGLK